MFTAKHYVPLLIWKQGEQLALANLDTAKFSVVTPFIELPPIPYDWANECASKTLDSHLDKVIDTISISWKAGSPVFLDTSYIPEDERLSSGQHYVDYLLSDAHTKNVPIIPVTNFERDKDYQGSIKSAIHRDGLGVCFRLTSDMLRNNLKVNIDDLLRQLEIKPSEVDIVLDFKSIVPGTESMLEIAIGVILSSFPYLMDWRTITFLGSGMPQDLSGFGANTISTTPRTEWVVWNNLVSSGGLPRNPSFGDYTTSHPIFNEIDPRIINPSASVRYTTASSWYIFKGKQLRGAKGIGFSQYVAISGQIVANSVYSGISFSWGDGYINDCHLGKVGTGNLTTWKQVGVSHHLAFVADQVASHPSL